MAARFDHGFQPGYVPVPPHPNQPQHQRVRNTIALYGISGRQFARRAGVNAAHLSRFFKGYRVRPETMAKIEEALMSLQDEHGQGSQADAADASHIIPRISRARLRTRART